MNKREAKQALKQMNSPKSPKIIENNDEQTELLVKR